MKKMMCAATLVAAVCVSDSADRTVVVDQLSKRDIDLKSDRRDSDVVGMDTDVEPSDAWEWSDESDVVASRSLSDLAQRIVVLLAIHPGLYPSDLALHFDCSLGDVVDALDELLESGVVARSA